MNRISRVLAVAGISGALAVGGAGIAQASPDHGTRGDHHGKNHDKHHGKHEHHGKNHK